MKNLIPLNIKYIPLILSPISTQHISIFERPNYMSTLNTQNTNDLTLKQLPIPKLNIKRNQVRLTDTVKALTSYIQLQSGLDAAIIVQLVTLLHKLEMYYFRNDKGFVTLCKLVSNWLKSNIARNNRKQDAVQNQDWNKQANCPTVLLDIFALIERIDNNKELLMTYRMLFSIFDIYKVVQIPRQPSINTITDKGAPEDKHFTVEAIDRAIERLGLDPQEFTQELENRNRNAIWHSSSASGPNGQAVWMSHMDAQAINQDPEVRFNLLQLCKLLGREDLFQLFEATLELPQVRNLEKEDPVHSRLHFIFESGDKVRTIAILDWWTQELLTPFHTVLNNALKTIPMDGTHDQDKIAEKVRLLTTSQDADLFSLDLTAATDRLPRTLQIKILQRLVKYPAFGMMWAKLLTERDFTMPGNQKIQYAVGQPMGAKSSFTMLALTHHVIIQEAAFLAGRVNFDAYVILGDDVLIADKLVAENYKALMADLGLEISPFKSIECISQTSKFRIAEICKRLFINGAEVSPIPVKLLANTIENGSMAYQLQEELDKRGLIVDRSSVGEFLINLLRSKDDIKLLVKLNILPSYMTGMRSQINIMNDSRFTLDAWLKERQISEDTLNAFFKYTVIQEQMKRMSNIIQSSESTFDTLVKASRASNNPLIGFAPDDFVKVTDFAQEHLDRWNVVKAFHPAREVMFAEVNRISTWIMQLSVSRGYALVNSLLDNVIDSLKVSVMEMLDNKRIGGARVTRTLIDKTIENILYAQRQPGGVLTYSAKFNPMNIIWYMKVAIGGECTISRSASRISTTKLDASLRFREVSKTLNINDIFAPEDSIQPGRRLG